MFYLRITAVPLPRETNPINSPLAEISARLAHDDCCEIRFVRKGNENYCFLGLTNPLQVKQCEHLLSLNGYLYTTEAPPACAGTEILLHREIERRLVAGTSTPEEILLPHEIRTDATRTNAFFQCLSSVGEGSGVAFLIRRSKGFSQGTLTQLHRAKLPEENVFTQLLNADRAYEMVGAVFGIKSDLPYLLAEALYAFPSLTAVQVKTSPIDNSLFNLLDTSTNAMPFIKPLCRTYLKSELEALSDLSISAGKHGLRINKDTIFGIFPCEKRKIEIPALMLGRSEAGKPVEIPLDKLTQHMFMGGASGSGKGNELFFIVNQLHENKIPTLIIESAKAELHHLRKTIPDLKTWRPEENSFICNPFALQGDITLGEMRDAFMQIMKLSFKTDGPLEELFSQAMNNCFVKNGFSDTAKIGDAKPFGLHEFIMEFNHILNETDYSGKTRADIKTAGAVRLNSLFNMNRGVYDTCNTIPVEELLTGYNLVQLNSLTTVEAKQMFASMLLVTIGAYLRLRGKHSDGKLRLAVILDESHNLLQAFTDSEGKEFSFAKDFCNMILELRSQGIGFIVCDQSANHIPKELVDSCQTKVFLGGDLSNGIKNYTDALGGDEASFRNLYPLGAGEGIMITEKMPQGEYFHAPNVIRLFRLNETDYKARNRYLEAHPRLAIETFSECSICPARSHCTKEDKIAARQLSSLLCQQNGNKIKKLFNKLNAEGNKERLSKTLDGVMFEIYNSTNGNESRRYCTTVQFARELNRSYCDAYSVKTFIGKGNEIWKFLDEKERRKTHE